MMLTSSHDLTTISHIEFLYLYVFLHNKTLTSNESLSNENQKIVRNSKLDAGQLQTRMQLKTIVLQKARINITDVHLLYRFC